jgi:hypothetical protein
MTHDKIRAAARKRMAETGEPYAAARREVIKNHQETGPGAPSSSARWFAISYSDMGPVSLWSERRHGGGPGRGGVAVDPAVLRVRMAGSIWTSPAARCDRPLALITRPGERSEFTPAEAGGS